MIFRSKPIIELNFNSELYLKNIGLSIVSCPTAHSDDPGLRTDVEFFVDLPKVYLECKNFTLMTEYTES